MNCPKCGTKNPDDFAFCLQCGERLAPPPSFASEPSRPPTPAGATIADVMAPPASLDASFGPSARLRVEQGSVDQREFQLVNPSLVIGRRLGNDLVIHDTNVSRQHARVVRDEHGFLLEDLNSSNGTLVNEEKLVGSRPLRNGDVIRIGDAVLVFESEESSPPEGGAATVAMDMDSPLTSLGQPMAVEPPEQFAPPSSPLTPPPPIMESSHTTLGESLFEDEALPSPGPATPATAAELEPGAASSAGEGPLEQIRRDLSDLNRDLADFAGQLNGLADRVERLDASLAKASDEFGQVSEALRGPGGKPLADLKALLADMQAAGGPSVIQPVLEILEQLAGQPRDIELLLKLSQRTAVLDEILRLHVRIMEVAPAARDALDRALR
jgi:pSer/pThr/pTyr-binding forkhead associated (FHA) protein